MNQATFSASPTTHARCRQIAANGRRCRLQALDAASGLCFRHSSLARSRSVQPDPAIAAELLSGIDDFSDADSINRFLGNVVRQLVYRRISRRDAIALAYMSQLLLNSLGPLGKERDADRQADEQRQFAEFAQSIGRRRDPGSDPNPGPGSGPISS